MYMYQLGAYRYLTEEKKMHKKRWVAVSIEYPYLVVPESAHNKNAWRSAPAGRASCPMPGVAAAGDTARRHTQFFIVFAVVFHAIYASSIFDIYFRSPVVHGMTPVRSELPSPARRVVLFVADGLRADRFYELISDGTPAASAQPNARDAKKHSRAPFLRRIIEQSGSWGVSHTRVPTESRPGHVALLAGLYEDLSSVTTGWETNPVTFDSVLNGSSHAWCFGSPDIVPMFSESLPADRASVQVYSGDEQNMSPTERADKSYLDAWVFDRVRAMFQKATAERAAAKADGSEPSTLVARLKRSQTVFFLHLLGIDTNGHAHRPASPQYLHNIGIVDKGIKEVVETIEGYFGDGRTAYVFSADHGMGSRGAHGDGHPENTRTPFVVWGAGVRSALQGEVNAEPAVADAHSANTVAQVRASTGGAGSGASDKVQYLHEAEARAALAAEVSEEEDAAQHWGLNKVARVDVLQADVAPLMASLAGLQLPLNSEGVLPIGVMEPGSVRAAAALANARQLLRQAAQKEALRRQSAFTLTFRPSADLARGERELAALLQTAERLGLRTQRAARDAEQHAKASADASRERAEALRGFEAGCMDAADAALRALLHYQHYDQPFLASVVVLGYAGWAVLLLMQTAACGGHTGCGRALGDDGRSINRHAGLSLCRALREALPVLMCASTLMFLDSAPLSHHVYVWFALGFWNTLWRAFVRFKNSRVDPEDVTTTDSNDTTESRGARGTAILHWALALVLVLGALESIVFAYSDGTYNRAVFSVCFFIMGAWPWYSRWRVLSQRTSAAVLRTVPTRGLSCFWALSCCGVAIFPLLPIDPTAVQEEIVGGGAGGDGVGGLLGVQLDGDTMLAAGGITAIGMTALAVLTVWRERWRQQRQHEYKGRQQAEAQTHGMLLSMSESSVSVGGSVALVAQLLLCCCALWLALFGVTARLGGVASHDPQRDARYQGYARLVALAAPCLTLFSDRHFAMRLLSIFAGLVPVYILLSVHYEVLFICTLACALGSWVLVEQRTSLAALRVLPRKALAAGRARPLMLEDMRTALFFLLFINVSFFATGNVASISSFELSSVYRFITKFSPFTMGALLVLKLLIPFFFVASAFGIIDRMTRLPPYCLYLLVFSMCDVLAIHIFFAVKTEGSWKEIGNSISHFVIINMFVLACPLMVWLSRIAFTNGALIPDTKLE